VRVPAKWRTNEKSWGKDLWRSCTLTGTHMGMLWIGLQFKLIKLGPNAPCFKNHVHQIYLQLSVKNSCLPRDNKTDFIFVLDKFCIHITYVCRYLRFFNKTRKWLISLSSFFSFPVHYLLKIITTFTPFFVMYPITTLHIRV